MSKFTFDRIYILYFALFFAFPMMLTACSASADGPSDDDVELFLWKFYGQQQVRDISKSECELSNNRKSEGITERWVIQYTAPDQFTGEQEQKEVTIQEKNGEWEFWSHAAYCGS